MPKSSAISSCFAPPHAKFASGNLYLPARRPSDDLKIEAIIREEMNRTGASGNHHARRPADGTVAKTGRDIDYGETLGKFIDRHGRAMSCRRPPRRLTYLASCEIQLSSFR
jgi:hypothetical protein